MTAWLGLCSLGAAGGASGSASPARTAGRNPPLWTALRRLAPPASNSWTLSSSSESGIRCAGVPRAAGCSASLRRLRRLQLHLSRPPRCRRHHQRCQPCSEVASSHSTPSAVFCSAVAGGRKATQAGGPPQQPQPAEIRPCSRSSSASKQPATTWTAGSLNSTSTSTATAACSSLAALVAAAPTRWTAAPHRTARTVASTPSSRPPSAPTTAAVAALAAPCEASRPRPPKAAHQGGALPAMRPCPPTSRVSLRPAPPVAQGGVDLLVELLVGADPYAAEAARYCLLALRAGNSRNQAEVIAALRSNPAVGRNLRCGPTLQPTGRAMCTCATAANKRVKPRPRAARATQGRGRGHSPASRRPVPLPLAHPPPLPPPSPLRPPAAWIPSCSASRRARRASRPRTRPHYCRPRPPTPRPPRPRRWPRWAAARCGPPPPTGAERGGLGRGGRGVRVLVWVEPRFKGLGAAAAEARAPVPLPPHYRPPSCPTTARLHGPRPHRSYRRPLESLTAAIAAASSPPRAVSPLALALASPSAASRALSPGRSSLRATTLAPRYTPPPASPSLLEGGNDALALGAMPEVDSELLKRKHLIRYTAEELATLLQAGPGEGAGAGAGAGKAREVRSGRAADGLRARRRLTLQSRLLRGPPSPNVCTAGDGLRQAGPARLPHQRRGGRGPAGHGGGRDGGAPAAAAPQGPQAARAAASRGALRPHRHAAAAGGRPGRG
jgi:hypothetical protein